MSPVLANTATPDLAPDDGLNDGPVSTWGARV
jgi:hypothetical protein